MLGNVKYNMEYSFNHLQKPLHPAQSDVRSGVYPKNAGHDSGIHSELHTSPSQGTTHTFTYQTTPMDNLALPIDMSMGAGRKLEEAWRKAWQENLLNIAQTVTPAQYLLYTK